jgi:hypothetical protein
MVLYGNHKIPLFVTFGWLLVRHLFHGKKGRLAAPKEKESAFDPNNDIFANTFPEKNGKGIEFFFLLLWPFLSIVR